MNYIEPDILPPTKIGNGKPKRKRTFRLLLILFILLCGLLLWAVTPKKRQTPQYPFLGNYYPEELRVLNDGRTPICDTFSVVGEVKGAAEPLNAYLRLKYGEGLEHSAPVENGVYRIEFDADEAPFITVQLFNMQGESVSGKLEGFFVNHCSLEINFGRYTPAGELTKHFEWDNDHRLNVSFSDQTGSDVYGCNWYGFIGNTFDEHGALNGKELNFEVFLPKELGYGSIWARNGDNPEVGPGGWAVRVPPGHSYTINMTLSDGRPFYTLQTRLEEGDCQSRVIKIAIGRTDAH